MPRETRSSSEFDDADDEALDSDRDDPQERDVAEFGEDGDSETIPCPSCRRPIWEMADRCSFCGAWVEGEPRTVGPKAWWIAGVLIVAMLVASFFLIR